MACTVFQITFLFGFLLGTTWATPGNNASDTVPVLANHTVQLASSTLERIIPIGADSSSVPKRILYQMLITENIKKSLMPMLLESGSGCLMDKVNGIMLPCIKLTLDIIENSSEIDIPLWNCFFETCFNKSKSLFQMPRNCLFNLMEIFGRNSTCDAIFEAEVNTTTVSTLPITKTSVRSASRSGAPPCDATGFDILLGLLPTFFLSRSAPF